MAATVTLLRGNFIMSCRPAVRITPILPGSLALFLTWLGIPTDMHTCQMTQAEKWSRIEPYQNVVFCLFFFVCFPATFCISTLKILNFHFNYFYLCRYTLTHCRVSLSKIENDSDKLYNPGGDDLVIFMVSCEFTIIKQSIQCSLITSLPCY